MQVAVVWLLCQYIAFTFGWNYITWSKKLINCQALSTHIDISSNSDIDEDFCWQFKIKDLGNGMRSIAEHSESIIDDLEK